MRFTVERLVTGTWESGMIEVGKGRSRMKLINMKSSRMEKVLPTWRTLLFTLTVMMWQRSWGSCVRGWGGDGGLLRRWYYSLMTAQWRISSDVWQPKCDWLNQMVSQVMVLKTEWVKRAVKMVENWITLRAFRNTSYALFKKIKKLIIYNSLCGTTEAPQCCCLVLRLH